MNVNKWLKGLTSTRILCQNKERFKDRFLLSLTKILSTGTTEGVVHESFHKPKHGSGQSEVSTHLTLSNRETDAFPELHADTIDYYSLS